MRRERPHPGAQLSFTDHDGYRSQAILTNQDDEDIAVIECRHRQHAHVEDRIRDDKDTGLAKIPLEQFALNEVWLEIVMLAHDLIVRTQALLLEGELAKAEPKRLRYWLLHIAGRRAFSARRAKLHLQDTWPWATELDRRLPQAQSAPSRNRLTAATHPHHRPLSSHGRDHPCPHTSNTTANDPVGARTRPQHPRPTPPRTRPDRRTAIRSHSDPLVARSR